MSGSLLRVYFDPAEIGSDGYPHAWHGRWGVNNCEMAIKDLVRELAGNRCVRCGHPYAKGDGQWSSG